MPEEFSWCWVNSCSLRLQVEGECFAAAVGCMKRRFVLQEFYLQDRAAIQQECIFRLIS